MRRAVPIVVGVAVLAALFLVLRPGGDEPAPDPSVTASDTGTPGTSPATSEPPGTPTAQAAEIEVAFEGGQVQGPDRLAVDLGERVHITVTSDVAEEVHVHTYDFKKDVGPGSPAVFDFVADISGVFEVELEGAHVLLFRLEVGA